jgi:hypothetical protein
MRILTPENAINSLPPEILDVLGPPPLLSTEDEATYYTVFAYFVDAINPKDILVWMRIKDLADYHWEIRRLRRIKVDIVQNAQEKTLLKTELDITSSDELCGKSRGPSYIERLRAAQCTEHPRVLKALREGYRAAAYSLDSWIADVEKVDRLLEDAEKRYDNTLREIECHLGGFGETIRQRRAKILDGEVVAAGTAAPVNIKPARAFG